MSFVLPEKPYAITNSVLAYRWGIPGGISARFGYGDTTTPEAELWIGAHPKAPSKLAAHHPDTSLKDLEDTSGTKLPYLLKVLAVNEALSIQAHPSTQQAAAGFARENAAGIPLDAPSRNYRDANAKPELIVALENGFAALCGFRDPGHSAQLITGLAAADSLGAEQRLAIAEFAAALTSQPLADTVLAALRPDPEERAAAARAQLLTALVAAATSIAEGELAPASAAEQDSAVLELAELICELDRKYHGDLGIIVAALLNRIELRHGQALWLPPGTPHAYLRGYGVEIMGASDNVLRGGLTEKHIDTGELCATLDFTARDTAVFEPTKTGNCYRFNPDPQAQHAPRFELIRALGDCTLTSDAPLCLLVVSGSFEVTGGTVCATAKMGDSYLLPGRQLSLKGSGEAYIACGAVVNLGTPAVTSEADRS